MLDWLQSDDMKIRMPVGKKYESLFPVSGAAPAWDWVDYDCTTHYLPITAKFANDSLK